MIELKNKILGLTLEEATVITAEYDYYIRVVMKDGKHLIGTRDYRMDRINVYLQENIIVKANFG